MPGGEWSSQSLLLEWFDAVGRDLPWRRTRDAWAILVSETMLQQTQVARVVPRYHAFLNRFPEAAVCAEAPSREIVQLWDGLGYNRRALNLHRAAQAIVEVHGGVVPSDLADLMALPGVGPYTARAVAVFAHEQDHGVVDTNVVRVIARAVVGRAVTRREAQMCADVLVPSGSAWAWNQALFDLGATTCTKRRPSCGRCPLSSACRWHGTDEDDPALGSAGSGVQPRFVGSDRQGRGRLIAALRQGSVAADALAMVVGWPDEPDRAERIVQDLIAEGFVQRNGRQLELA